MIFQLGEKEVEKTKGIRITEEAYIRLLKLKAKLTAQNGKARTFSDIVNELLEFYERHKPETE
ncbi:MAG: hypothetical protein QXG39_09585 [Candidatus Aenigmatarchaeota archaeon]